MDSVLKSKVYNSDESMYLGTLSKAVQAALSNGFSFMLFNGIVYFITRDGRCFDTELKKNDLIVKV